MADGELLFDAFAHPRDRDFRLWDVALHEIHRTRDDTGDLLSFLDEVIQPILNEWLVYVDHWSDIIDPGVAPEGVLDRMLADLGNPFPFVMTVAQKRALVQTLVDIYRKIGTAAGLEAAIRFFVRIEATVIPHLSDAWEIGIDELGVGTYLGGDTLNLYSFDVEVAETLTADELVSVTWLSEYMKPSHEHLISVLQP